MNLIDWIKHIILRIRYIILALKLMIRKYTPIPLSDEEEQETINNSQKFLDEV